MQIGNNLEGGADFEQFGFATAISGDGTRVVVGAPFNSQNSTLNGVVRVLEESGGTWTQIGSDIYGTFNFGELGRSVDISSDGTRIAIGLPGAIVPSTFQNSGIVQVFEENGGVWTQVGGNIDGAGTSVLFG